MAENRTRFYSNGVIDLTQSDEEDLVEVQPPTVTKTKHPRLQAPGFITHDGLPTFEPHPSQRSEVQKQSPYAILPPHPRNARVILPPQNGLSKTNDNPSVQYQKSTGQASSSNRAPSSSSPQHGSTYSDNPAKRRKVYGEAIHQQATPILPPAPRDKIAVQPLQIQLVQRLQSSPVAKTIISGASRAESSQTSRISPEGRIKKPRPAVAGKDDLKATECLTNQIFRHVKDALRPYQDSLPKKNRTSIGVKVSGKLLDSSFYKEYNENDGKLSKEYESKLAGGVKAYVNSYAEAALKQVKSDRAPSNSRSLSHATNSSRPVPSHWPSQSLVHASTGSEPYSSDEEEIFEGIPKSTPIPTVLRLDGSSRTYSSSPTTSFSNDHTDGEKVEDMNGSSAKPPTGNHTQQLRRSRRAPITLRKSPNPLTSKIKPVAKSNPKSRQNDILKQNNVLELQQADVDAAREMQSLLLAARAATVARPYLSYANREDIKRGLELSGKYLGHQLSQKERQMLELSVLHVDFCLEELKVLYVIIVNAKGSQVSRVSLDSHLPERVMSLMAGEQSLIPRIQQILKNAISQSRDDKGMVFLRSRSEVAVTAFLQDAAVGEIAVIPHVVRLEARPIPEAKIIRPKHRISSLLMQRELYGTIPQRIRNGQNSFRAEVTSYLEDSLTRLSEWTDCCGDISAISWTSKTAFVCGATAHSDLHNMQYNKPGNLVLGSSSLDTLRAISNHRIIRPIVAQLENAENSLESMRQTQDPWLYTSVVSSAHSEISGLTFTASFDETVKVWKVAEDGSKMDLRGAWYHDGKVNFVITSEHHDRVATASDVSHNAVRVYSLDKQDIPQSAYDAYGGNRAQEQGIELRRRETWAYFPATIQWGKTLNVSHLLLVGYSPRSLTAHEHDIPEDKQNTGELCLWNTEDGSKVNISSAKMQNVFEVMWHPTQPIFVAATSPTGTFEPGKTKTQIRVFAQLESGTFHHTKVFDCPAMDINELTIMPNSAIESYVTASCTDGKTYIYDTAQSDQAIHILRHGESLDNPIHDMPRELADTGVMFAAWGQSKNRFYTGASDGRVKAWDITAPAQEAFIRDVLVVSGGISAGAFSKDFSQLVIGDATGKIHLIGPDSSDLEDERAQSAKPTYHIQGKQALLRGSLLPTNIKRPKVLIPHPEPAQPIGSDLGADIKQTGKELAQVYVEEGHIRLHEDPAIGAVQGPNYVETGLFRTEAHEGHDGMAPLLPSWQAKQQVEVQLRKVELSLPILLRTQSSDPAAHRQNMKVDLKISDLPPSTLEELKREGVELDWDAGFKYPYEVFPGKSFSLFREDPESRLLRKQWEKNQKMKDVESKL